MGVRELILAGSGGGTYYLPIGLPQAAVVDGCQAHHGFGVLRIPPHVDVVFELDYEGGDQHRSLKTLTAKYFFAEGFFQP